MEMNLQYFAEDTSEQTNDPEKLEFTQEELGRTGVLVNPKLKGVVYNQFNGSADYRTASVAK